jgi:hypothetical protein
MKFNEWSVMVKVKYSSWDKMNDELGGEATDEQITDYFCSEYMSI